MANNWQDWTSAYERAYEEPSAVRDIECPNCTNRTLVLVFSEKLEGGIGYASFWCDTCMYGIHLSRTQIPDVAEVITLDGVDDTQVQIKDYIVVWPAASDPDDEDTESKTF
ncbi:hypothetical protein [Streptomyces sp. NPDC055189]